MYKRIGYLMAKDTRFVVNNLTKVIIDKDVVDIKYTVFRKDLNDETITALRYYKSKKLMFIYDKLKKYNKNVYNSFIKWARENKIKCKKLKSD